MPKQVHNLPIHFYKYQWIFFSRPLIWWTTIDGVLKHFQIGWSQIPNSQFSDCTRGSCVGIELIFVNLVQLKYWKSKLSLKYWKSNQISLNCGETSSTSCSIQVWHVLVFLLYMNELILGTEVDRHLVLMSKLDIEKTCHMVDRNSWTAMGSSA